MPTISVITPVYNCEKYLGDTINSVIAQTYSDWELILVDDKSTDESAAIAESFCQQDNRIHLLKHSANQGAAATRNTALAVARGEYLAFLDSDDLFHPNKLETQIKFMQDRGILFSYSAYQIINEHGNPLGVFNPPAKINYTKLLKSNSIGCLTAVFHRTLMEEMEKPIMRIGFTAKEDYILWLRILKKIAYGYSVKDEEEQPLCLASYRIHGKGISSNKMKVAQYQWRVYREVEKLGIIRSAYYFFHYAINGLKKYRGE